MSIIKFIQNIMKYYCPHDILKDKEPEKRCDRFNDEYGNMACTVCWILNIEEHENEEDL